MTAVRTVFVGRAFSLEVDQVALPSGREVQRAVVRHPPSVVLIPVRDDGRLVMIRQYRHALRRIACVQPQHAPAILDDGFVFDNLHQNLGE